MSDTKARIALLPDRGVVSVRGPDAHKLLQGIITNDMDLLAARGPAGLPPAIHAGLLTPQGKILIDFLVVRLIEGGHTLGTTYLLETARDKALELVKRLTMYRLRSSVTIEDAGSMFDVLALWDAPVEVAAQVPPAAFDASPTHLVDPREPALGLRWYAPAAVRERLLSAILDAGRALAASADDYHAHRIALGIPEGGRDYDLADAFPHEACFDLHHGVSFDKGCYVGQEVVSRTEHRALARKRVVRVTGAQALPASRPEVLAGAAVIGRLGSVAGRLGLAMLRLDRVAEALGKGQPITAAGITVTVDPEALARYHRSAAERAAAP